MFNSLFRLLDDSYFPYTLKSKNIAAAVKAAFPEIAKKYGDDVEVSINLTMVPNNTATPIKINMDSGITLGSLDDVSTTVSVMCSNATVNSEETIMIGMNMMVQGNFSMKELVFYPTIDSVVVENARVKKSKVQVPEDISELIG